MKWERKGAKKLEPGKKPEHQPLGTLNMVPGIWDLVNLEPGPSEWEPTANTRDLKPGG